MQIFEITKKDKATHARRGVIHTPHGDIQTPSFSPVATKASVKSLDPQDLNKTNTQVILANTYHLYLQPGIEIINSFGGFSDFMGWSGPTITDSGGYQVSFLWDAASFGEERAKTVKVVDEGAEFTSHIDGSKHFITPEKSMQIQAALGADIIMAFDQPLSQSKSNEKNIEAFERTMRWEERSFAQWQKIQNNRKNKQAIYGVIQGETDKKLRKESVEFLVSIGFPGLAVGGESIGSDPTLTSHALDTIVDLLPDEKPIHALGLGGGPEGIFNAVERGVDTFDNTGITRMARTGIVFIYPQDGGTKENKFRIDVTKTKFKNARSPLSSHCHCYTCQNFSLAYLRHLFVSHEMLGPRLATIHNITYINDLMLQIRIAIEDGDFEDLKNIWLIL
jgi:queuine tRNA-ribosyltransferase